ncbi:DUF4314 domain-containing protein [Desulfosporosinus sp. I2]|uniref:DUF4314 domain-containing protein n=1 Tax=Desulfosporosinus sp. I2 TaxID=1617025 RepID=UPI000A95D032|nr:DUF4314 domain-containing protein [Desulfosporosinus sp. I2]
MLRALIADMSHFFIKWEDIDMMSQWKINAIKKDYPQGTRVELGSMAGEQQMPLGLQGTVEIVDDIGQIHVKWDNGRNLALVPEEDSFRKLPDQEQGKSQQMIL